VTPKQFKVALGRLGLTQVGFGRLIGYGEDGSNVRKWISGRGIIPPVVAIIVRLMLAGKISVADIEAAKQW